MSKRRAGLVESTMRLGSLAGATATLSPEIYSPDTGNALYVFALD